MDKETKKMFAIIDNTYPRKEMSNDDLKMRTVVWQEEFAEVGAKYVYQALKKYRADRTRVFAPTMNDIHRILDDMTFEAQNLLFLDKTFSNIKIPDMCADCEGLKQGELQFLKPCKDIICPRDNDGYLNNKRETCKLTDERRAELLELVNGIPDVKRLTQ